MRSTIASGVSTSPQRLEDHRLEPVHPGGVGLHDQHRAEPVDDQPGQAVGLGMDQPVIGRVEQPLAQLERPLEPADEEAAADRPRPASRSSRRAASSVCGLNIATPSGLLVGAAAR